MYGDEAAVEPVGRAVPSQTSGMSLTLLVPDRTSPVPPKKTEAVTFPDRSGNRLLCPGH